MESNMNGQIPSWEEWNEQLTQEQRHYSLYKILQSMDAKMSCKDIQCKTRVEHCEKEFLIIDRKLDGMKEVIRKRRVTDKVFAAATGLVGGFLAFFTEKIMRP